MAIGKAYSFFYCGAPAQTVQAELPTVRRLVETPSDLELVLYSSPRAIPNADANLPEFIALAMDADLRYALGAFWSEHTGGQTMAKLVSVMNQLYGIPTLYGRGEEFRGEIVFEEGGRYLLYEGG